MVDLWQTELAAIRCELIERMRSAAKPMRPLATEMECRLRPAPLVDVVLFDIYGTLLVSAAGDVQAGDDEARRDAFTIAAEAVGVSRSKPPHDITETAVDTYLADVARAHREALRRGVTYPEVDVRQVWCNTFAALAAAGHLEAVPCCADLMRFIAIFESLSNPVWPMPEAMQTLERLGREGRALGVVSNAQFYTPLLFPALLGRELEEFGFDAELCAFSFERGMAKPSPELFEPVLERAHAGYGAQPTSVLMVGNDLLNDLAPAAELGCKTALFAGDRRSLRLRTADPRCRGSDPDIIVTHLSQLAHVG
jgi:putative hydrolase of the HAD superfamily